MKGITSYQSANLSDEEILQNFIVRKKEFHRIMSEIEKDDMSGSIQHYLLIGRRGSGKSTLLRRIMAEVNRNDKFNEWLIVIYLSEEQAGVYRLYDLWDMIVRELNVRNITIDVPIWTDEIENRESYTIDLYKAINRSLNDQNKKLLLLLDNIDRIFDNIADDSNILRELLINYKDLRIVGGSTRMSEHYWKYDLPFYQFFKTTYLDSLSSEEVKELLLHWSDCLQMPEIKHFVDHNPGKIETIRTLTDGMPRTLLNFLEILIDRPHQKGFEYLRMILDRASPLYQERLNFLAPAQRKVVLELSSFWDATGVKSLVDKCKMPGKTISALLNQLHKDRIVEKVPVGKRDNLYRISERFFNLWLLMTQGGPKEKRKVKYLTVFLENWYNKEELSTVYSDFIHVVKTGNARHDYLALMASALASSKYLTLEQRDSIAEEVKSYQKDLKEYQLWIPTHSKELYDSAMNEINTANYSRARELISEIEQESHEKYLILALANIKEKKYHEAEQLLFKSINQGNNLALRHLANLYSETGRHEEAEKYYLQAIEKGNDGALYNLAILYTKTGRHEEAEKYYLQAIANGETKALNNLAYLYSKIGRYSEAEKCYLQAIEKDDPKALFNLANLYSKTGRHSKAEKYYLQAIEKDDPKALFNLAFLYSETGKHEKAEKYYLQAIEIGDANALNNLASLNSKTGRHEEAEKYYMKAIDKGVTNALFNLANLYSKTSRHSEAEKYYLQAIENGDDGALLNLGNLYSKTGRPSEAEKYYLQAIKKDDPKALFNLANLYSETGRCEDAEKYYLQAIEKGNDGALYNLANLYSETGRHEEAEKYYLQAIEKDDPKALFNLAYLYLETGRHEEAEKYYLQAIEKGVDRALINLAILYAKTGRHEEAEKYYLQAIEKGVDGALINLANLYSNTGRNEEAEKYYLLAIGKDNHKALNNLANLFSNTGRLEEAEKYYLQAIKKGEDEVLINLAFLYYKTGRLIDAEQRFKEAIDNNHHLAFHYLAWFYYLTNNRKMDVVQLMQNFHKALPDEKTPVEDAILYLYAGQMDDFNSTATRIIPELIQEDNVKGLTKLFSAFLIHKQYHFAWEWFNNPETGQQLKEMIKPFYYATAQFLKGKDIQIELLKPGSELTEAIEQIISNVNEKQKFYYG